MDINNEFVKKYDRLILDLLHKEGVPRQDVEHYRGLVYERLITNFSYDEGRGKFTTWLGWVIKSVVSNERKKYSRSKDALDHAEYTLDDANNIIGQEDAGTVADELDRIFKAAINISHRDKGIVRDVYLEEMTVQETADKNSMEVRAVEQVVYRAMKALRQSVEDDA